VLFPSNECGSLGGACNGGTPGPIRLSNPPTKSTFVMWFKTISSSNVGLQVITGTQFGGGCDRVISINNGIGNFNIWSEVNYNGPAGLNDGQWHFLVHNFESNRFAAYIDSQLYAQILQGTTNGAFGPYSSGFNWADTYNIGSSFNCRFSSNYFNGIIDEVRIYNRPLSSAEIKSLYEATR
jgi:hypothetical protein